MSEWQQLFGDATFGQVLLWAVVITGAGIAIARAVPPVRKLMRFVDDVAGEPARPGHPARPGLMERVASIEDKQSRVEAFVDATDAHREHVGGMLEALRHEVQPNTGSSLRDVADRTEKAVAEITTQVSELVDQQAALGAWQEKHETKSDAVVERVAALEQKDKS